MKQIKKILAIVLALVFCLSGFGGSFSARADEEMRDENAYFDQWMMGQWIESMESDYLTMHYNVKDYESYYIQKPEVTLGTISIDDYAAAVEENKDVLAQMDAIMYDRLSPENQVSYDVLRSYVEQLIVMNEYPQFEEMFNPYNGYLTNLETNFTEFVFYQKEDIEDYLTLIADYPRFIDEMWAFTETFAKQGYFMTDAALDEELSQIDEFVAKGVENPLIIIFSENVDAFEGLTDQERADYKARNSDLVINQVLPAYQKAATNLETLRGSRQNDLGICGYPGGDEYYAALAKYESSTNMTPQEIYDFCETAMDNIIPYFRKALSYDSTGRDPDQVEFTSAEEVLDYLASHLDAFPKGPDVNYKASYLDKCLENPSVVAYYLTPPVDDITNNVIRINGSNVDNMNEMYITLSHEGFPGHLYQFTWYFNTEPNPLRTFLNIMGYQEGWAMYVENIMIRESGLDKYSYMYEEANNYYGYVYNTLMEIGINGLHWTVDDFLNFLNADGNYYTPLEARDIYDQLRAMPGTMISYGFGDAYFMTLRAMCQKAMGQYFDEVAFHEVLLTNGPRNFEMVQADVEEYIARQGYKVPSNYKAYEIEINGVPTVEKAEPVPEESSVEISYADNSEYSYESSYDIDLGENLESRIEEIKTDLEKSAKKALTASIITAAIVLLVIIGSIVAVAAVGRKRKKEIEQERQQQQWRQWR
ncbi:MAG: DUF885 domain-containing protein [Firmicutes bacterium]|nr:DUF885 domain-containing protein [Bacillota bacterium]